MLSVKRMFTMCRTEIKDIFFVVRLSTELEMERDLDLFALLGKIHEPLLSS